MLRMIAASSVEWAGMGAMRPCHAQAGLQACFASYAALPLPVPPHPTPALRPGNTRAAGRARMQIQKEEKACPQEGSSQPGSPRAATDSSSRRGPATLTTTMVGLNTLGTAQVMVLAPPAAQEHHLVGSAAMVRKPQQAAAATEAPAGASQQRWAVPAHHHHGHGAGVSWEGRACSVSYQLKRQRAKGRGERGQPTCGTEHPGRIRSWWWKGIHTQFTCLSYHTCVPSCERWWRQEGVGGLGGRGPEPRASAPCGEHNHAKPGQQLGWTCLPCCAARAMQGQEQVLRGQGQEQEEPPPRPMLPPARRAAGPGPRCAATSDQSTAQQCCSMRSTPRTRLHMHTGSHPPLPALLSALPSHRIRTPTHPRAPTQPQSLAPSSYRGPSQASYPKTPHFSQAGSQGGSEVGGWAALVSAAVLCSGGVYPPARIEIWAQLGAGECLSQCLAPFLRLGPPRPPS